MPTKPPVQRRGDPETLFAFLLLAALPFAPPALVLGIVVSIWLRKPTEYRTRRYLFVGLLALLCLGALYLHRMTIADATPPLPAMIREQQWDNVLPSLYPLWIKTLLATPAFALFFALTLPRSTEEVVLARDAQQITTGDRQAKTAQRKVTKAPDVIKRDMVLGAVVGGDLHHWRKGPWLAYPQGELAQHALAVGASGSGKTETLLRLAYLAATVYGYQVLFVDAKGDVKTAGRFLAAMRQAGMENVPLFPTRAYNGWEGDSRALHNRLLAVQTFSEPYYADVAALVLSLALNAPAGQPRTSMELVQRLGLDVLRELYQGQPDAYKVERLRAEDVRGVYQRYAGFFDAIGSQLDGGWTLSEVDVAYLLLDGTALKHEAASLGRYLLEDIAHYVTARKQRSRKVLLVIDEFSAISGAADAANLFERIRSFGASVVVSSQSYAGLGRDAEKLLGAATTLFVHACSDPERLAQRAGTVRRLEYTHQTDERGATGRGTIRPSDAPRIDPNAVRQLKVGECFVIAHGRAARVQMARLPVDTPNGDKLVEMGGWLRTPTQKLPTATNRESANAPTERLQPVQAAPLQPQQGPLQPAVEALQPPLLQPANEPARPLQPADNETTTTIKSKNTGGGTDKGKELPAVVDDEELTQNQMF